MERFAGRVALVTGASVGIGAAIAKSLVQSGMIVIGAARRYEQMQEMEKNLAAEKGKFVPVKCDLEIDENIYSTFDMIKKNYGGVDVLVNNAATIHHSRLLEGTPEIWRKLQNLNVISVALCSQLAVKSMLDRKVDDGQIVMVSSVCAFDVMKLHYLRFYSTTKFALRAYTSGLRHELTELNSGIRVSSICPGPVDTEIWQYGPTNESEENDVKTMRMVSSDDIASSVLHMVSAPKHVEIHDLIIQHTFQPQF